MVKVTNIIKVKVIGRVDAHIAIKVSVIIKINSIKSKQLQSTIAPPTKTIVENKVPRKDKSSFSSFISGGSDV